MIRSFVNLLQNFLEVNERDSKSETDFNERVRRKRRNYNTIVFMNDYKKMEKDKRDRVDINWITSDRPPSKKEKQENKPSELGDNSDVSRTKEANKSKQSEIDMTPAASRASMMLGDAAMKSEKSMDTINESDREIYEVPMSSREIGSRTSHTNVNKLYHISPKPKPPLTERALNHIQQYYMLHDEELAEHVKKMYEGMQRLQEVAQKFQCSERYKEDIDYLVKNVATSISKTEARRVRSSITEINE